MPIKVVSFSKMINSLFCKRRGVVLKTDGERFPDRSPLPSLI